MKFEEVLPLMRQGKKAKTLRQEEGEYYQCCYMGLLGVDYDLEPENRFLSITKMLNEYVNDEMKKGPPFMYIVDIMSDDWEIVE